MSDTKFIRRNGKIIPIRQKSAKKKSGGYAAATVGAAGVATAAVGARNAVKGAKKAGENFRGAVKHQKVPAIYGQYKAHARTGAKQMKKGVKQMYAGIAVAGAAALLNKLRKK